MKSIYLLLFTLISISTTAQTPSISFQKSLGGDSYEDGIDVVSLANGDFVVCGASFSDISGDKTSDCFGRFDYWIVKITTSGSIVWQTTIGGNGEDMPNTMIQTSDGGFLITGSSSSPISGNKNSINYGLNDVWVVKLNSSGQLLWEKSYGGASYDFGIGVVQLANGNYFLANSSMSTASGNKSVWTLGGSDYWCIIIDRNGNILNQFVLGGKLNDNLTDVVVIDSNHVLLTGSSNSNISSDKNENSLGHFDYWLVVSDLNGNIISSTTQGGSEYDTPSNAVVGVDKNIRVFGASDSPPSGNKTALNYGYNDYWVVTLDSNLNKISDSSFGGESGESSFMGRMGVYYSAINEYVIAGKSTSDISGNKLSPLFSAGMYSSDIWVVGMDMSGLKTFEFVASRTGSDQAWSIIETVNNTICIIGTSTSDISGNKTDSTRGMTDIWLIELDFHLSVDHVALDNDLQVYPNPTRTVVNFSLPMTISSASVSLTDLTGKVVYKNNINGLSKSQIDVSHLPSGVYVLNVNSSEFKYNRKVVIE